MADCHVTPGRLFGYARVSTEVQETRLQLDALSGAGVELVFQEKASSVGRRPELQRLLGSMSPGDVLVVWRIDRLARSLNDLLSILERLSKMGCGLRSITEPIDTTTPMGVFVLQILGAVAQLERAIIIQRTKAGVQASMARGTQWGPRPILQLSERLEVAYLFESGYPPGDLADAYGISRPTAYVLHRRYLPTLGNLHG